MPNSSHPIPLDFLPLFYNFNAFTWLSFVVILLSTIGSLYILLRLKFKWSRLRSDHHFGLRFILAILLFINRSLNLCQVLSINHVFALYNHLSREGENYALYLRPPPMKLQEDLRLLWQSTTILHDVSHVFNISSLYFIMAFLLFLTLDRYKRVHMVLPGTKKYYFFKCVVIVYSLLLTLISIVYGWQWIGLYTGPHVLRYGFSEDPRFNFPKLESIAHSPNLILSSIRGVELSFKSAWKNLFREEIPQNRAMTPLQLKHVSLNHMAAQNSRSNLIDPTQDKLAIIRAQKRILAIKMFSYFLIVIVIDLSIFAVMILANRMKERLDTLGLRHEDVIAFVFSWLVFHVLIIYELLDLFLKELKKSNIVKPVQNAGQLAHSVPSTTDIVEDGLISEYHSDIQSNQESK